MCRSPRISWPGLAWLGLHWGYRCESRNSTICELCQAISELCLRAKLVTDRLRNRLLTVSCSTTTILLAKGHMPISRFPQPTKAYLRRSRPGRLTDRTLPEGPSFGRDKPRASHEVYSRQWVAVALVLSRGRRHCGERAINAESVPRSSGGSDDQESVRSGC